MALASFRMRKLQTMYNLRILQPKRIFYVYLSKKIINIDPANKCLLYLLMIEQW